MTIWHRLGFGAKPTRNEYRAVRRCEAARDPDRLAENFCRERH